MQTLHPVLKHGGLFSDWEMLPRELFAERLARLQAAIAAAGDDAWLIYGDAQRYGDIAWISHFVPRLRSVVVLVPRAGQPCLLASIGSRDVPASKILTWFDELRPYTRLPGEVINVIRERGLDRATVGVVGTRASLPVAEWTIIADGLPGVTWIERDAPYATLRATKDAAEDAGMRRAADAVALGLGEAARAFRPGITVREATSPVDRAVRYAAAEDVRILVATGADAGHALAPSNLRMLAPGDVVQLFIGAEVQRYWAEGACTLALGDMDAATFDLKRLAERALAAMIAAVTGGARAADVAAAAEHVLGPRLSAGAAAYGFGHGIGLDADERPSIRRDSADTIPADGALALHVVLHDGGTGAIAGTTLLVRDGRASDLLAAVHA